MVIDQIVAKLRYIQKEAKITNFSSSTTLTEISQKLYHQVKRAGIGQIGTT